jgi:two-component system, NarL family, nitrate/nitrite response regulator NarL
VSREEGDRKLRVLIADDHAPTRSDVREMLEEAGVEVVAEAADGVGAIGFALRERPDVCILDVSMPHDGLVAAEAITRNLPATKVVMLTVSENEEHVLAAARAGASGYLLKGTDPSRLPSVVRAVAAGESSFPRRLMRRLVEELRESSQAAR